MILLDIQLESLLVPCLVWFETQPVSARCQMGSFWPGWCAQLQVTSKFCSCCSFWVMSCCVVYDAGLMLSLCWFPVLRFQWQHGDIFVMGEQDDDKPLNTAHGGCNCQMFRFWCWVYDYICLMKRQICSSSSVFSNEDLRVRAWQIHRASKIGWKGAKRKAERQRNTSNQMPS